MYNRVTLMGRLVADPELRQTQGGVSVCRLRLAVDRNYVKKGEERKADFIDITCWRNLADFVAKYFTKGKMILVEGSLHNNNYTDSNGVKRYGMTVLAEHLSFCGDRGTPQNTQYAQEKSQANNGETKQAQQKPVQAQDQPPVTPPAITPGDLGDFEEILSDGEVPF